MYYGARYYDAALGRFLQPDSIVPNPYNPQDLNRYSYTRNNPLRYTDPHGRFPWVLVAALVWFAILPGDTGPYPADPMGDAVADMALRTAFEPYDRVRTGQECLSGECGPLEAMSILPLVPGGLGRLDDVAGAVRVGKHADTAIRTGGKAAQKVVGNLEDAALSIAKRAEGNPARAKIPSLPVQTHHAAAFENKTWTSLFEGVTAKYGLDLKDAWNEVGMPHKSKHADQYHAWVYQQMQRIDQIAKGDSDVFVELYDHYVNSVVTEFPEMVRKEFWE